MAAREILERAWDDAVPKLVAIRSSLVSAEPPEQRVVRVGQLDTELLDQELARVLQEPISKALALVSHTLKTRIEPELNLLVQLVLYKLSVWDDGRTYGARLQDLRYVVRSDSKQSLTPSGLPRITLLCHSSLTILLPYLHSRLRTHGLSQAWPDAPSSDRRRKAWEVLTLTESLHTLLGLVNFVAFLWSGRYRTLADRLLHMRLVPSRSQLKRDVSYEFMNRQMVWHAFTEFLLFLLPLLHTRSFRRRIHQFSSHLNISNIAAILPPFVTTRLGLTDSRKPVSSPKKRGKFWSLPVQDCAICAENASLSLNISEQVNMFTTLGPQLPSDGVDSEHELPKYPINVPYVASCGDIYCYSCIAERLLRAADEMGEEQGWECLRCTEKVTSTDRYEVEIMEVDSGSDYEFSSDIDLDATDMSESMGSYSESGHSDG